MIDRGVESSGSEQEPESGSCGQDNEHLDFLLAEQMLATPEAFCCMQLAISSCIKAKRAN
jgi:hypothetical protein